jgi:hypothetical protein
MAVEKKKLTMGTILMVLFTVVLVIIFMPVFPGVGDQKANGLDYLDNLYNTISKGSAYYIPKVQKEAQAFNGKAVEVALSLPNDKVAQHVVQLVGATGATASAAGKDVKLSGDWGKILAAALADADLMYHNKGAEIKAKYQGIEERAVVFAWWNTFKAAEKDMNRQKLFAEAKMGNTVQQKAVECAYNYYGVNPQNIGDKWGLVTFSLVFYVIYTMWYGFGIMFLFEGAGFRLEH